MRALTAIRNVAAVCAFFAMGLGLPSRVQAQQQTLSTPSSPAAPGRLGVQGFGTVGMNWMSATDSFEAVGINSQLKEFGGGAQVNHVWRDLFARVSVSRWTGSGERTFVDDAGGTFGLGIGLDIEATYVDATAGWKFDLRKSGAGPGLLPYVGAGAGVVMYSEKSPFAEAGDDMDEQSTSYHVLGGMEIRLLNWVGVAGEVSYRVVPDLLAGGGVSSVLREESFGGTTAAVRILIGF